MLLNEIRKNAGLLNEKYDRLSSEEIYHTGLNNPSFFDFKKGLNALLEKDENGHWIYMAGENWEDFDFKKGLDALEKTSDKIWFKKAKETWPKSYPEKLKDVKDKYDENHIPTKRKKLKR